MIALLIAFAIVMLGYVFLLRASQPELIDKNEAKFNEAIAEEESAVLRSLLKISKPLTGLSAANLETESKLYKNLRLKLAAAGDKIFSGSVEVYIATQVACAFVGSIFLILAIVVPTDDNMITAALVLGGVGVIGWPYSKIHEAAKKRTREVNSALPEFAELLLMPLSSGYGILPALDFTATRLDSPVAREVRILMEAIRSRTVSEKEAFIEAGENLGTTEARSFFAILAQAYLEGVRVADTISAQADQLRKLEYERIREKIKKAPNTIAVYTGIHLIPSIFLIVLFPTFEALGSL